MSSTGEDAVALNLKEWFGKVQDRLAPLTEELGVVSERFHGKFFYLTVASCYKITLKCGQFVDA